MSLNTDNPSSRYKPTLFLSYFSLIRNKKYCLLVGKSFSPNIVYQGKITSTQTSYNDKVYFGVAENSFKGRFYNHTKSFTHEDYANNTELSKEYLEIERNNFIPKVIWSIVRECPKDRI